MISASALNMCLTVAHHAPLLHLSSNLQGTISSQPAPHMRTSWSSSLPTKASASHSSVRILDKTLNNHDPSFIALASALPSFLRSCLANSFALHQESVMAENRGPQAAAVAILFLITSWLAVMLRVYVRGVMTKSFGIDDTLAVVTLVGDL